MTRYWCLGTGIVRGNFVHGTAAALSQLRLFVLSSRGGLADAADVFLESVLGKRRRRARAGAAVGRVQGTHFEGADAGAAP